MFTSVLSAILFIAIFAPTSLAHGYLSDSCVTRGQLVWPSSAPYNPSRGYPLVGSTTGGSSRPYPDTLPVVPQSQQTVLKPGPFNLILRFGAGANHQGPCRATIGKRSAGASSEVEIGAVQNCAKSLLSSSLGAGTTLVTPAVFTVTIPQGWQSVPDAYIRFELLAQHISTTNPEIYQDICDVKIDQNTGSNSIPASALPNILVGWSQDKLAMLNQAKLAAVEQGTYGDSNGAAAPAPAPAAATTSTTVKVIGAAAVAPSPSSVASVVGAAKIAGDSQAEAAAPAKKVAVAASPAAAPANDESNHVIPPVPTFAGSGSVPSAVADKCGDTWNQCNLSWLQAGAKDYYTCQRDYTVCISSGMRKRMHKKFKLSSNH